MVNECAKAAQEQTLNGDVTSVHLSGMFNPAICVEINIVAVKRVAQLITENPGILNTVFTARETGYCMNKRRKYEHMSARLAVKEAIFKAFGTGHSNKMQWTDVEVIHGVTGKPYICLYGEMAVLAEKRGLIHLDVSLAHTVDIAAAYIMVVWNNGL